LNHLANELILRESDGDAIQSRPPLSAHIAESVAISALLDLKYQRPLTL
jgi:hypothetical protein